MTKGDGRRARGMVRAEVRRAAARLLREATTLELIPPGLSVLAVAGENLFEFARREREALAKRLEDGKAIPPLAAGGGRS